MRIETFPEWCTGCLCCQLQCSFVFTGMFNPADAKIVITRSELTEDWCRIEFTDGCTNCGLCADACLYGALSAKD